MHCVIKGRKTSTIEQYFRGNKNTGPKESEWNFCSIQKHAINIDPETGEEIKFCWPHPKIPLICCERMTLTLEKKRKVKNMCYQGVAMNVDPLMYVQLRTNVPTNITYYILMEANLHKDLYTIEKSAEENREQHEQQTPNL